jgi:hypothetical protein
MMAAVIKTIKKIDIYQHPEIKVIFGEGTIKVQKRVVLKLQELLEQLNNRFACSKTRI